MTPDQIPERLAEFIKIYDDTGQKTFKIGLILGCVLEPYQVIEALDILILDEKEGESEGEE